MALRQSIGETARSAGREPDSIRLVAVSKHVPASDVLAAYAAGQTVFGENRVQELVVKAAELAGEMNGQWHMIGTLQTNKVKHVVGLVSLIHSVDSLRLLETIERRAGQLDLFQEVLLQVNVSGEASKHGLSPDALDPILERAGQLTHVRIRGLMTMAPLFDDPERTRPVFALLRELRDRLAARHGLTSLTELSMGMTGDYRQAIREGATLIRVGSALFGYRLPGR